MLSTSVSLGVAAIPEGLPTVAITTLALGIRHMQQRNVLVRQLNAVETLGAISVMCLDKTGTITVNRMTVAAVFAGMRDLPASQLGPHVPSGPVGPTSIDFLALLQVGVLCSEVEVETTDGVHVLKGSATESALVQMALDAGVDVQAMRARHMLLGTQYRSEARSYMATLHRLQLDVPGTWRSTAERGDLDAHELLVSVKGRSPEVLAMCRHYLEDGRICELGDVERLSIEIASERMAGQALRVLGFACARRAAGLAEGATFTLEGASDLVWLGLVGMSDPPREGMREILAQFHGAGVRTVMITGDQSATAHAIGKAIGLSSDGHLEILGATELEGIAPDVLRALVQRVQIFSRVSPAHKLHIVQALQGAGKIVAMTGDGINDSPALKAADVGVAMGMAGTSAAREVADVILQDDNLETMITGIEQGRVIYDDIKKAVHFILATNTSEILIMLLGIATGAGEMLTPMQLLWINIMTDIFPELALVVQPPEADVLRRPPRDPQRSMFERRDLTRVAIEGGVLTAGSFAAYLYGVARYGAGPRAGTLTFTVLTIAQLLHSLSARSESHSIFDRGRLAPNKYIPMAMGGGMALQILATLVPGARRVLGVVPLGLLDWGVVGLSAVSPLMVNEALKVWLREPELVASLDTAPSGSVKGS
jgi:Ca2+-transporting ATPase